jgi:hypothetical protein
MSISGGSDAPEAVTLQDIPSVTQSVTECKAEFIPDDVKDFTEPGIAELTPAYIKPTESKPEFTAADQEMAPKSVKRSKRTEGDTGYKKSLVLRIRKPPKKEKQNKHEVTAADQKVPPINLPLTPALTPPIVLGPVYQAIGPSSTLQLTSEPIAQFTRSLNFSILNSQTFSVSQELILQFLLNKLLPQSRALNFLLTLKQVSSLLFPLLLLRKILSIGQLHYHQVTQARSQSHGKISPHKEHPRKDHVIN